MSSQGPFLNRISNNHSIPDRGSKTLPGQTKLKKITKNSLAAINQSSLSPEQSNLFEPITVKNPYKQDSNMIIPPLAALHRELARISFKEFVRQALAVIEPGTTFYLNWMTDAICNHLQATAEGLARGEQWPAADPHFLDNSQQIIRDLIINVPPRSLKSTITSVLFPAWCWVNWPNIKFMFVSFSHNLSKRDSRNTRRLIESKWYQRNWGNRFTLSADSNTLLRFDNNAGGFRYAVSVGGQILGEGYQCLVCDDMNNTKDIHSKVKRDQVKNIWDDVFPTRSNNKKTAVRIIICQRSHDDDLTGHVLRKNKLKRWVLLRIPCEFEKDFKCTTPLPWEDPRKNDGDLICPERDGPAEIAALKEDLSNSGGSFNIAAQLQQRPVPVEGGVFEHDWWQLYRWADLPAKNQWEDSCISVDMSFGSIKDTASFTVMQAWCKVGNRFYLLGQKRGRWKYTKAKRELVRFIQRYHYIYAIYVENKANGPAVMDDLGETEGISGLIPVEPDGDKVARAYAVSPLAMAKNVFIPDPDQPDCEWVREEFFPEVDLFPMAANDDITDTLTQALRKLRGSAAFGMSHDDLDNNSNHNDDLTLNGYDSTLNGYDDSNDPGFGAGIAASSTSNAFGSSTMQTQTNGILRRKDPVEIFNSIGSSSVGSGAGDFWGI